MRFFYIEGVGTKNNKMQHKIGDNRNSLRPKKYGKREKE
jgi:hypothetical protein